MKIKFLGREVETHLDYVRQFIDETPDSDDKYFEIDIQKFRKKRSLSQNAYMWVICTTIAEHIGLTKEKVYRMLNQEFNVELITLKSGKIKLVPGDAKELDTVEFGQLITKSIQWAQDELGLVIKTPEQWREEDLRELQNRYEQMFF